jgi:NADH dehydrogenase FAD-containing subunit
MLCYVYYLPDSMTSLPRRLEFKMSVSSLAKPTVVVIGGGYGGINVAKSLDDVAEVVLMEPKDAFVHNVAALRALADPSWLPKIFFSYDGLLSRGWIVRDRAVKVEPGRVALASGDEIEADYVVLSSAPGSGRTSRPSCAASSPTSGSS